MGATAKQRQFCAHTLRLGIFNKNGQNTHNIPFKDLEKLKWFAGTGTHTAQQSNSQSKHGGGKGSSLEDESLKM